MISVCLDWQRGQRSLTSDKEVNASIREDHSDVYINTTVRISDSWELDSYVLCMKELRGSRAAIHVAESIGSTLDEFFISCEAVAAFAMTYMSSKSI